MLPPSPLLYGARTGAAASTLIHASSASKAGAPIRDQHARRYLLAEDVIAFFVFLSGVPQR